MGLCDKPDIIPPLEPGATAPIVSLASPTGLTDTTVTLTGSVDSGGTITSWHFEYGLDSNYGSFAPGVEGIIPAGSSATVSTSVAGLRASTTYHYRLHASNGAGISNTSDGTFVSSGPVTTVSAPTVSQSAASSVTSSGAVLNGTVVPNGASTSWHWTVSSSSGTSTMTSTIEDTVLGTTVGHVEYTGASWNQCAGCAPPTPNNSHYYAFTTGDSMTIHWHGTRIVFYAPNDHSGAAAAPALLDGVSVGTINFFTSNTDLANGIRYDSGLIADGDHTLTVTVPSASTQVITFDRAEIYTGSGTVVSSVVKPSPDGIVTGGSTPVSVSLTGLVASTTYTYALTGANSAGTNTTSNSTFTTSAPASAAPTVVAGGASSVTTTSATVSGTITPNGSNTAWHVEYGLTTGYGTSTATQTVTAGAPASVSTVLTGLTANSTYHYRFVGTNAGGTVNSGDAMVTTNPASTPGFWPFGGSLDTNHESDSDMWQANMASGRPVTLCTVYNNRSSWGMCDLTQGQTGVYTNKQHQLLLQTSPFPEVAPYNYAALINGDYDSYWIAYGAQMAAREAAGFPPIIVSIAWEFNGTYFYWGGGGGTGKYTSGLQYQRGYQRIVTNLRVHYPNVITAWVINGWGSTPIPSTDCYPGDAWVTLIGGDWYDHFNGAMVTESDFLNQSNAADGPLYFLNMVRSAGPDALGRPKKLLVPEWGIDTNSNGHGDHPNFITWMYNDVFKNAYGTGHMAGEAYFNEAPGSAFDIYYSNPNSRTRYQGLYHP